MIKAIGINKVRGRFTCVKCNARLETDDFDNDVVIDSINGEITYYCPNCKKVITDSYYDFHLETEEYVEEVKDESDN